MFLVFLGGSIAGLNLALWLGVIVHINGRSPEPYKIFVAIAFSFMFAGMAWATAKDT